MAGVASGKDRETMSKRVFLNERGGGYEVRVTDPKDSRTVGAVQEELRKAAEDQTKASTPAMQEHQQEIIYRYEQTNRGGRLRIETKSPDALRAIQNYLRSQMDHGKSSRGVAFSYIRNTSLVVVPVMVNEHGPFRFLLDTGASNSILSASVADGLHIRSGRSEILLTAGGNIPVTLRTIQAFQIGEARLKNAEIAVADFSLLQTLEIDGILGGDYLRKFKVSIDYEKQVVQIEPLAESSSMLIA